MHVNTVRKTGPLAGIVILLASLYVYRPGPSGLWQQALFNWMHVPVFGLISLSVLALLPNTLPTRHRFAFAMMVSLILAVTSEAAQIPLSRDASWNDIFSNATGAASFLMAAFAIGKRRIPAAILLVLAGAILIWSATPLITVTRAIAQRNFQFPVIFNGDIESNPILVKLQNVDVATQSSEIGRDEYSHVELSGTFSSRLEFHDVYPNWNDYSSLIVDLEIEGDSAMLLGIRVDDRAISSGTQGDSARFDRKLALEPGRTRLEIPIREIASAAHDRRLDTAKISRLVIYSSFRNAQRTLRLYEIRLD